MFGDGEGSVPPFWWSVAMGMSSVKVSDKVHEQKQTEGDGEGPGEQVQSTHLVHLTGGGGSLPGGMPTHLGLGIHPGRGTKNALCLRRSLSTSKL